MLRATAMLPARVLPIHDQATSASTRIVPPQPAHRVRENGSGVSRAVSSLARNESMVVAFFLERRGQALILFEPAAPKTMYQGVLAVLLEHPDGFCRAS